jgi:hypothetical protein
MSNKQSKDVKEKVRPLVIVGIHWVVLTVGFHFLEGLI